MKRRATFIICGFDLAAWALIAGLLLLSGSDPATRDLDVAAAVAVTVLIAFTALPGFLLARAGRAPDLALAFALGFPFVFLLLLAAIAATMA